MKVGTLMIDFLGSLNTRYSLSKENFYHVKRYYLGMYKSAILELYDMGYTQEMNVLLEKDLLQAYISEGINLKFLNGKIKIKEWVFFLEGLLYKKKYGKENQFYTLATKALMYKRYSSSIDTLYDNLKIYKSAGKKTFSLGFSYSPGVGIYYTSRGGVFSRATYDLLLDDDMSYVKQVPIVSPLLYALGSDTELLGGVRLGELGEYLEPILTGGIHLDNEDLSPYISDLVSGSHNNIQNIDSDAYYREVLEPVVTRFSSVPESKIIGIDNYSIYVSIRKDSSYVEVLPFGTHVLDYETGEVLSYVGALSGLTGDFININSSSLLQEDGFYYIGCPVYIGSELYVDSEQVSGLGENSLIHDLGLSYDFVDSQLIETEEEYGLLDFYVNSFKLVEAGVFYRELKGAYTREEKDLAIKKAVKVLNLQ